MQAFGGGRQLCLGIGVMLFGLFIVGVSIGAIFITRSIWLKENFETLTWKKTPCVVDICEVEINKNPDADAPFTLRLLYFYEVEGESKGSSEVGTVKSKSMRYEELSVLRRRLLNDSQFNWCYVNPEDPGEAVLIRAPILSRLLNLILPMFLLFFVAIGVYVILAGLRPWIALFRDREKDSKPAALSLSPNRRPNLRRLGVALFGFVLFLGLVSSYSAFLRPLAIKWRMASWVETPVTIKEASNANIGIFYSYQLDGKDYHSNSYSYRSHVVRGQGSTQAIVKRYPVGSQQMAYVNPKIPEQAVLNREAGFIPVLGLLAVLFIGGGLAGLAWVGRSDRFRSDVQGSLHATQESANVEESSPRTFHPSGSRWARLAFLIVTTLLVNGGLFFTGQDILEDWRSGEPDWAVFLFMAPFFLAGIGLIGGIVYTTLALFTPKVVFTLSSFPVRAGETVTLSWQMQGMSNGLLELSLAVEGVETACYATGPEDTTSDAEVFFLQELFKTTSRIDMHKGSIQWTQPASLPPTFDSGSNQITWRLRVRGPLSWWPNVNDIHEISVIPPN